MPHIKPQKGYLVTRKIQINPETGEIINETETRTKKLETVQLKTNKNPYSQYHKRLHNLELSPFLLQFVFKISKYIEYETGRLTVAHVGRTPIPLKTKTQISDLTKIDRKTVGKNMNKLLDLYIFFKIKGELYLNPSFISFGKIFRTPYLDVMLEKDKNLRSYIPKNVLENVNDFKKVS